jgi:hypothetical protein
LRLAAFLALLAMPLAAQPFRVPPVRTVAQLGACLVPKIVAVSDAVSATDCTVGHGSAVAMCMCRPALGWTAFGNAGSGTVLRVNAGLSGLPWLAWSGVPYTSDGTATLSPAGGQTPGLVLGTFAGTSVTLGPLTANMVPSLPYAATSHTHPASAISDATAAGRGFLTAADATAQRSALGLGTASTLDVPASGDASSSQVVKGNDSRLVGGASVALQGSSPGTPQTGNVNVTGFGLFSNGVRSGTSSDDFLLKSIGFGVVKCRNGNDTGDCILDVGRLRAFAGGQITIDGNGSTLGLTDASCVSWATSAAADQSKDLRVCRDSAGNLIIDGGAGVAGGVRLTPGPVGSCGSAERGLGRVAADGTWCTCNGTTWTATPASGSCT